MEMEFKVILEAHGFEIGKDISETEWQKVQAEFMTLWDYFVNATSELYDKINDIWETYEYAKELDKLTGNNRTSSLMAISMGIPENYDYNDWIEKWYKQIAIGIDAMAAFCNFEVRSNIFRDENEPKYGGKFKDKPEWTINMTVEPVG